MTQVWRCRHLLGHVSIQYRLDQLEGLLAQLTTFIAFLQNPPDFGFIATVAGQQLADTVLDFGKHSHVVAFRVQPRVEAR
jgi:hypothetical protein